MTLEELVDLVETMIVQHDYPGFEPRALNLGLPEKALKSPAKVFGQALKYKSIYVQLASLRWFQERPSMTKTYLTNVLELLEHNDEWVRLEAVRTLERANIGDDKVVVKICSLLKDTSSMVRQEAAKALGKLLERSTEKNEQVISWLREAAQDPDRTVRWKAQKALRKLGAYSVSA
jgi:HEAT repeat protein